jgi:hypothetical protein
MNALVLPYPDSRAATVTFSPQPSITTLRHSQKPSEFLLNADSFSTRQGEIT